MVGRIPLLDEKVDRRVAIGLLVSSCRGNWHSFEPLVPRYLDAALASDTETLVATRVIKLSA